jgi:hypothetical protein
MDANYEDAFPWLVAKYTVSGVPATITGLVFTGSGVTYNF